MTYEEFITEIWERVAASPQGWRKGQAVFNIIDERWGVAREVQFVDGIDCFYNDDKIQEFIDHAWIILKDRFFS